MHSSENSLRSPFCEKEIKTSVYCNVGTNSRKIKFFVVLTKDSSDNHVRVHCT